MNRHLIATRFPQWLTLWNDLPLSIMRADMIRYFILYEFGGVYADLDFEALQSLDNMIVTVQKTARQRSSDDSDDSDTSDTSDTDKNEHHSCILGQEPKEHAHVLYKVPTLVCNALMASCPGHPFWMEVIELIAARHASGKFQHRVLKLTGPMVVQVG